MRTIRKIDIGEFNRLRRTKHLIIERDLIKYIGKEWENFMKYVLYFLPLHEEKLRSTGLCNGVRIKTYLKHSDFRSQIENITLINNEGVNKVFDFNTLKDYSLYKISIVGIPYIQDAHSQSYGYTLFDIRLKVTIIEIPETEIKQSLTNFIYCKELLDNLRPYLSENIIDFIWHGPENDIMKSEKHRKELEYLFLNFQNYERTIK